MTLTTRLFTAAAALSFASTAVCADPAVLFDLGGKFDKSFNESAYNGAERWGKETGNSYASVEIQSDAQREQAIRRFAEAGNSPIVMAGFGWANALTEVSADYPDTKFQIVDMVVDAPNVRSVVFAEEQGSYLVGMMAAMASKSGTVSFIGGMDIPLIRNFACGYAQGVKAANPDAKILSSMTGTTHTAWNDPVKGSELTLAQISQGSDVVYAAAGGTGVGVLQTAADKGILSIGVDSNQNYFHPGKVLTSMMKRVDNAMYDALKAGNDLEAGLSVMDLSNGGVSYALDEHNEALVTAEMKAALDDATAKIVSGEISVHNYQADNTCPDFDF